MQLTYAPAADALHVELVAGLADRTIDIGPLATADLDADGRLLSVEILCASTRYPINALTNLTSPAEWLTLAEAEVAAREEGESVAASTWRVLANSDRIPTAAKRKTSGRWQITRAGVWNYLESRAASGRPSPSKPKSRRRTVRARR